MLLTAAITRRSVLAAVCGLGGFVLLGLAFASGFASADFGPALVISAITLAIGTVLLALGQAIWRLLGDAPEEGS